VRAPYKVGQVVQLLSGGPTMTVTVEENGEGFVELKWFTATGELRSAMLHADVLRPY
jgi:uncharacterized protein YodC (DUF2158 family)